MRKQFRKINVVNRCVNEIAVMLSSTSNAISIANNLPDAMGCSNNPFRRNDRTTAIVITEHLYRALEWRYTIFRIFATNNT